MEHITRANSRKILKKIDYRNTDYQGDVYKKPIYFFNHYEEQSLLALKELLENPESFVDEHYNQLTLDNTNVFVFENANPAYHSDYNCPRIRADFKNYLVPREIIERGATEIEKYRAWFKEVAYLLEEDDEIKKEIFLERCRLRFHLSVKPEIYSKNNSGIYDIENLNLEELEERIDELLRKSARYYYKSPKHTDIIKQLSKYAYLGSKPNAVIKKDVGYPSFEVKEILKEYDNEIKTPIETLLREWYRVKFNPELSFEGHLLNRLGFKPCGCCHDPNYSPMQEAVVVSNDISTITDNDDLPF